MDTCAIDDALSPKLALLSFISPARMHRYCQKCGWITTMMMTDDDDHVTTMMTVMMVMTTLNMILELLK